MNTAD
jgi:hypothetical protein